MRNAMNRVIVQLVTVFFWFHRSAYKILLQTEEDRLTVVANQGLLTLSDVRLNCTSTPVS